MTTDLTHLTWDGLYDQESKERIEPSIKKGQVLFPESATNWDSMGTVFEYSGHYVREFALELEGTSRKRLFWVREPIGSLVILMPGGSMIFNLLASTDYEPDPPGSLLLHEAAARARVRRRYDAYWAAPTEYMTFVRPSTPEQEDADEPLIIGGEGK